MPPDDGYKWVPRRDARQLAGISVWVWGVLGALMLAAAGAAGRSLVGW